MDDYIQLNSKENMGERSVFRLHWLLAAILALLSVCRPVSPMPASVTASGTYPGSLTTPSHRSETDTPNLVTPSRSIATDTPEATQQPTIHPLMPGLPVVRAPRKFYLHNYLSTQKQAAIYATVIRRLAGPDDSFRGGMDKPFLFILTTTNDREDDYTIPTAEPQGLSPEVQRAIEESTADLSSEIKWVARREEVQIDVQHHNVVDGVILTLGNIRVGDDQRIYVAGSVFYTYAAAMGQTYVFEWREEQWVLVGRTPTLWIA